MKLTDVGIRRVNGNGKVQKLSDGGGLFLYVTPTGKKSWRMAYRFGGKQKLLVNRDEDRLVFNDKMRELGHSSDNSLLL